MRFVQIVDTIKRKGLIQAVTVYVAASFGVLQGYEFFANHYGWPSRLLDILIMIIVVCFPALVIRKLFHGAEADMPKIGKIEAVLLLVNTLLLIVGLTFVSTRTIKIKQDLSTTNKSILVLPFKNFALTKEEDYFADGVTSSVITELTKIRKLNVVSEAISFSFKKSDIPPATLAEQLGANFIIQGNVQQSGGKVKISAQLTDTGTGFQIWAEQFNRDITDLFSIQDEISRSIVKSLQLQLAADEDNRLGSKLTNNMRAYDLYLRGKYFVDPSKDEFDSAFYYLKSAIAEDPQFAKAYAELSRAYTMKQYWFPDPKIKIKWTELASIEADKALALDSTIAEAYFSKAFALWTPQNYFQHEKAIRLYKKVVAINPDYDEAFHQLSIVYSHNGQGNDALKAAEMSVRLNPNSINKSDLVNVNFTKREHQLRFKELFRKLPPEMQAREIGLQWLVLIEIYENNISGAEEALSNITSNSPLEISLEAIIAALKGKSQESLKLIKQIENTEKKVGHFHHSMYYAGLAYCLLGEKDKAVTCLRWSFENGFPCYSFYSDDPFLQRLKGYDPFDRLLAELKDHDQKIRAIIAEPVE